MSDLRQALDDYLALRRGLGFSLEQQGSLLSRFVAHVAQHGDGHVTTKLALEWAMLPARASPQSWVKRLGMVRSFALHLRAFEPATEIPPADLLPCRTTRFVPYLYSDQEIEALLRAAGQLRGSFKPSTYATLFGLLAVTGMRVGEAIALDRSDLDWDSGMLVIRRGKLDKAREIALHPTTVKALRSHASRRDRLFPRPRTPSFFVSQVGTRLLRQNVHETFVGILRRAGLSDRRPRRPRIHDLRHSFAMRTVRDWYEQGLDVEQRLPLLSTYLGHVGPSSTYWYLTATPELLALASQRLEQAAGVPR